MTKPFLLLQSRSEAEASDDEYQAFLKFGGLEADQLVRLRLERGDEPAVNLDDYTGIIMGGGPANLRMTKRKNRRNSCSLKIILCRCFAGL